MYKEKLILALDKNNLNEARELCHEVKDYIGIVKLGLEFFLSFGKDGFEEISKIGIPIFLDLKLHDIPNTVSKSVETLILNLPEFKILTLHASGGVEMLRMAQKSAEEASRKAGKVLPMLSGVTVLTSTSESFDPWNGERVRFPFALGIMRAIAKIKKMNAEGVEITKAIEKLKLMIEVANNTLHYWVNNYKEEEERRLEVLGLLKTEPLVADLNLKFDCAVGTSQFFRHNIKEEILNNVAQFAFNASVAGIESVVCSAKEAAAVKILFPRLKTITPGIRPLWYKTEDDQARILTPKEALANGADFLVIGRPITLSSDPRVAARKTLEEMQTEA